MPGDVEPGDVAPVATSDLTLDSVILRPSVAAAGEPGSIATEPAGPVSPGAEGGTVCKHMSPNFDS